MTKKKETVEEFLARGGKIEKLDAVEEENKEISVRGTAVTAPTLYHITEGQHLFAEKKKNRSKKKKLSKQEVQDQLNKIKSMGK